MIINQPTLETSNLNMKPISEITVGQIEFAIEDMRLIDIFLSLRELERIKTEKIQDVPTELDQSENIKEKSESHLYGALRLQGFWNIFFCSPYPSEIFLQDCGHYHLIKGNPVKLDDEVVPIEHLEGLYIRKNNFSKGLLHVALNHLDNISACVENWKMYEEIGMVPAKFKALKKMFELKTEEARMELTRLKKDTNNLRKLIGKNREEQFISELKKLSTKTNCEPEGLVERLAKATKKKTLILNELNNNLREAPLVYAELQRIIYTIIGKIINKKHQKYFVEKLKEAKLKKTKLFEREVEHVYVCEKKKFFLLYIEMNSQEIVTFHRNTPTEKQGGTYLCNDF